MSCKSTSLILLNSLKLCLSCSEFSILNDIKSLSISAVISPSINIYHAGYFMYMYVQHI